MKCFICVEVFWVVTSCNVMVEYQHFREAWGWRWR